MNTLVDYYGNKECSGLDVLHTNPTPAQISDHLHQATKQAVDELFPDVRVAECFVPFIAMHDLVIVTYWPLN